MCLFAETTRLKVAKEDIKCYKRISFFFNDVGEIKFATPFQGTAVPIDVLLGKQEFSALGNFAAIKGEGEYVIRGGVIHTYAFERDACENQCYDELVVACIIPKGTKYIEGYDGCGNKTIAAEKIKINAGFKEEKEIKEAAVEVENRFKKMYGY